MDNDKLLEDFFRSFKITLTNASSYPKNHPYFIKSVENFKSKLEETLNSINPLKIGITDLGLVVGEKKLTRAGFYDELAKYLHQRKIKSIEINSGINLQELILLFSAISMPQKEILKSGGICAVLGKEKPLHLTIEELDYSVFLQGQGRECNDIWGYMLKEAAHSNETEKLNKIADDFAPVIRSASENDIIGSEDIPANINEFLTSLRDKNKESFDKCSKEAFLWLLRNKKALSEDKLAKLKPIFNSLNNEDFSTLLWEGLTNEDNFDVLSLQIFSKISEQKNPPKIAEGLFERISRSQQLVDNPNVVKKIQDLLVTSQTEQISAVYYNTLEILVKNVFFPGALVFDQKKLRENYRYIVLSMIAIEKFPENLKIAAEALEKELEAIFEDNDVDFLKELYDLLGRRKKENLSEYNELEKKLSGFIENIVLNQSLKPELDFLLDKVVLSSCALNLYLDKIFTYGKMSKQVLTLFFRLFTGNLDIFYERLNEKLQNMEFLSNLIESLSQLDMPASLNVLEHIYSSANELVKFDALKAMRKLKKVDSEFLIRQVNTDSFPLRKNICSVLVLDEQAKDTVLSLLFKIKSPWGRKNKLLIENMQIAFDLGLIEAAGYIKELSRKSFFWNSSLRKKAKEILKEWNEL